MEYVEYKMCCDFVFNSQTFLVLRRIERHLIEDGYSSSCEIPVILVGF
jgi:hypothetical protein